MRTAFYLGWVLLLDGHSQEENKPAASDDVLRFMRLPKWQR